MAVLMGLSAPLAQAAEAVATNRIVTDGRTQTSVSVNGPRTDIRTTTVRGGNAFNSFSHFQTGRGTTVNLHVPGQANNLINVVRDSKTVINGTLNGYKNGSIGGNVYFATPNGFVVGKSGMVNVGSLTVTTPSRAFTESLIGPGGQISDAAVGRLFEGSFPVSPDGNISIQGRINAKSGVRLLGQTVHVHGPSTSGATQQQTQTFAATVNSTGMEMGGAIEVSDGGIEIVAAGKARVGGRLSAKSATGAKAPRIDILAKDDILIEGTAGIVVSSDSTNFDGGEIIVFSDTHLVVEDGAKFSAAAGAIGDGGFIELSGLKTVTLGAADIGLSAPGGKAGTLLIDPEAIEIVDMMRLSPGAAITLQATESITVTSTGGIDTRMRDAGGTTTGDSGDITLEAPTIMINSGGQLLADVTSGSGFAAGNITLTATDAPASVQIGDISASSEIVVDGIVRGGDVKFNATANATSSYTDSAQAFAVLATTAGLASVIGLNGAYNSAESTAKVSVTSNAQISASGNFDISAQTSEEASAPAITLNSSVSSVEAAVIYGSVDSTTVAKVESGATISTGGSLSVVATNEAALNVHALTLASNNANAEGAAAYGKAEVDTTAAIESGANVTLTNEGDVVVFARNDNDFTVKSSVYALGNSKAGLAIAISDTDTKATAHIGADIGTTAQKAGNVIVEANSETSRNSTSSSTQVGDSLIVAGLRRLAAPSAAAMSELSENQSEEAGTSSELRLGSALTIADNTAEAEANIAADAGHNAPVITAGGDVAVYSGVRQKGVRSNASSSIDSRAEGDVSVSAAIAVGNFTNNSSAFVGNGVEITGQNIGVGADTRLPITVYDFKWHRVGEVISNLTSVLNANAGVATNVLTSYANATAKGDDVAIAGAVNVFNVNNNTTAWIANGASLNQSRNGAGTPQKWSVPTATLTGLESKLAGVVFDAPVTVQADSRIDSVNIGGNYSWLTVFGVGGGDPETGAAVGGALNYNSYTANSIAGISDGASVDSEDGLSVNANSDDRIIAIAPTSGKGGSVGLNGILSLAEVNNTTHASVSNQADVTTPELDIAATEALAVVNIAGAITASANGAVGLGVAVSSLETDTAGYIGDNSNDASDSIDQNAGTASSGSSTIATDKLEVAAVTAADVETVAVAGSLASDKPSTDPTSRIGKAWGKAKAGIANAKTKLTGVVAEAANAGEPAEFSLSASGSSAVNVSELDTHASIDGATISSLTMASAADVTTRAVSQNSLSAGSGAAALDIAQAGTASSVAIAGAIAIGLSDNETTAAISNSTLTRTSGVEVEALTGGEQTVVGLGISLNASADAATSRAAAGSISVSEVSDRTDARVENSDIQSASNKTEDLDVAAYQTTDTGIGAGSLYFSGKTGFGLAFTYASIGNPDDNPATFAGVLDSTVGGFDNLNVAASESGQVGAGGAVGGYTENGLAGAIVVTEISSDAVAKIAGTTATPKDIDVAGVLVSANGEELAANDAIIASAWTLTASDVSFTPADTGYNYSGAGIDFGSSDTSASVTAVAGVVQAGKSNIGASVAVTNISRSHSATVEGVDIDAGSGDVDVAATDGARIVSAAVGVALASGTFAGQASVVTNDISNSSTAVIGGTDSTTTTTLVDAGNVDVRAANTSAIRTGAGTLALNLNSSAAGISDVNSHIGHDVTAEIRGAKATSSGDVKVDAKSSGSINATAIGAAVSGGEGLAVAGSVTTNIMDTDVSARIAGGSEVAADNNVGVTASNTDGIAVIAGSLSVSADASGVGASVAVNKIEGDTIAEIADAGTKVEARGTDSGSKLSVDSGKLVHDIDLGDFKAPTDDTPDLSETQKELNGLAVKATSAQAVVANAVSVAISAEQAIFLTSVTNVLGGETRGSLNTGVEINQSLMAGDTPDVFVGASSQSYAGTFGVAAGTLATNIVKRTTYAKVDGANVSAPGRMDVDANANSGASSIVIAALGTTGESSLGLDGSIVVNDSSATTQASVIGGVTDAGNLAVSADSGNGFASAAGTGAVGEDAAVGGAVILAFNSNTTQALVGGEGPRTSINLTGDLDVSATSKHSDETIAVAGVGAGDVGVAGMFNLAFYNNTTKATVQAVDLNQPAGSAGANDVTITAQEDIDLKAYVGGISGGGEGGIGAAANVVQFSSEVSAGAIDSNINADGAIAVDATSDKDVYSLTFTGGIGGTVGIGASVGVVLVGDEVANTDVADQLDQNGNGTVTAADNATSSDDRTATVKDALGTAASDAVSAEISGGSVKADSVSVTADTTVSTENISIGAGVSGSVGVGAGIAVSTVKNTVVATVSQATVEADSVEVQAGLKDGDHRAAEAQGFAGAGGLDFGLGAAVAVANVENSVTAHLDGPVSGSDAGAVTVASKDESSVKAYTVGVAAGAVGVGASVSKATKSSTVDARIAANSNVTGYTGVTVNAVGSGGVDSEAHAGAAGIVAGDAVVARAEDLTTINAEVGSGSTIHSGDDGLAITASGTPETTAKTFGVAVAAGGAVGASVAKATADQTISASVGDDVELQNGSLTVSAKRQRNGDNDSAEAKSVAGSGAVLVGIAASLATADSSGSVKATLGNGIQLPNGDILIEADSVSSQDATSTGVGVGALAVGLAGSTAESTVDAEIAIGTGTLSAAGPNGNITIAAKGDDTNVADSTAGAGGVLDGAASSAETKDTSTVSVDIGAGSALVGDLVTISARHNDNFEGTSNSINAGIIGGSGATTSHDATVTTSVTIADGVTVGSANKDRMELSARSDFTRVGSGVSSKGGAGGVYTGNSVSSDTNITSTSKVDIGDNVSITSGVDPLNSPGGIEVSASSFATIDDRVSLTTGGAITNASVDSRSDVKLNNVVDVGSSNNWTSAGVIDVSTYTIAQASNDAGVHTFGVAAVGDAHAQALLTSDQTVTIGSDSSLIGLDVVNLTAGRSGDGGFTTKVLANADATGYVRGLIAIPSASATSHATSNTTLTVEEGAEIMSATNVDVGGYEGTVSGTADGSAHGYELFFIPVTKHDSNPDSTSSSTVNLFGNLTAGFYHQLDIEIDCGDGVTCEADTAPRVRQLSGAPAVISTTANFNAYDYIDANYDPEVAETMKSGVSSTPVHAVQLSQLYASGGTVTINANTLNGDGSVTSYGKPTINLLNNSAAYLILEGGAYIPDLPGAHIYFTGQATRAHAGSLGLHEINGDGSSIVINNAYTGDSVGDSTYGPAMFVGGNVTNIGGSVNINNSTGSYGLTGNINAQQVNITVPEGVVTISATGPDGMYQAGSSPFAEWESLMYFDSRLNPANAVPDPLDGIILAVNAIHGGANREGLNNNIYSYHSNVHRSYVYFSNCTTSGGPHCGVDFARAQIPISYYESEVPHFGDYYFNYREISDFELNVYALVPHRSTAGRSFTYAQSDTGGAAGSAQIFGAGQVAIKATVININGRIEAGKKTDWSVGLSDDAQSVIDAQRTAKQADPTLTGTVDLGDESVTLRSGDAKIAAHYDIDQDAIVLDDVEASSGGAHILLDGKIINSSQLNGHLHINGGLGDVEIANTTDAKLIVGEIETGSFESGGAPVSRVKIVDRLKADASNTTTYLFDPTAGLTTYVTGEGADPVLSGAGATAPSVPTTTDLSTNYNPVAGTRFEWTLHAELERTDVGTSNWNWVEGVGTATNPWQYRAAATDGGYADTYANDSDPQGIVVNEPGGPDFHQTVSANIIEKIDETAQVFIPLENVDWTFHLPTKVGIDVKNSLRADNPFVVDFAGNPVGSVKISSVAGITMSDNVQNSTGLTDIRSSDAGIDQLNDSFVLTKTAEIHAKQNIGASNSAFNVNFNDDGALNASGGKEGVHFNIATGVEIGTITAQTDADYGDVSIAAVSDVTVGAGTAGVNVTGRDITISSADGNVGEGVGKPLVVSAFETTAVDGATEGGNLDISARRDISVTETGSGDMRVVNIDSQIGDVVLNSEGGSIIDARDQTSASGISADRLAELSQRLGLTTAAGGTQTALTNSVTSFENSVDAAYTRYFRFQQDGTVTDGVYVLDAQHLPLFEAATKQALGLSGDPTSQQIRDYANEQYQSVTATLVSAYGDQFASLPEFQSEDPSFAYTATADQISVRTNDSTWLEGQLISAINSAALRPSSGSVGNASPAIVGRNVTLNAVGGIGSLAAPLEIDFEDLKNGDLTGEERAALVVATAPGSVTGSGEDGASNPFTDFDLLDVPDGVTITTINVSQTAPVFVNASGTLNADAQAGDVFIESTPGPQSSGATLTIGQISASGSVGLAAPQAILGAERDATSGIDPVQIIAGGDLQLTTASDNIGTLAVPLTYRIGGHLVSASAGADAFLRTDDRDMIIGRVFAQGEAHLTAESGSIVGYLDGVAIAATDIHLEASDDAGTAAKALSVQVGSQGTLSGTVGGLANIYSPTQSGQDPIRLNIQNFATGTGEFGSDADLSLLQVTATGDLAASAGAALMMSGVDAGGDLAANSVGSLAAQDVVAGGSIDFNSGQTTTISGSDETVTAGGDLKVVSGALRMDDGSGFVAEGQIDIEATGVAVIGGLKTNLQTALPTPGIRIVADRILSSGATLANLQASSAEIAAHLTAQNGIGTLPNAITVQGPRVTASTVVGEVSVAGFDGDVSFESLASENGLVSVKAANGQVEGRSVVARGLVSIHGSEGVTVNRMQSHKGSLSVSSAGNIHIARAVSGNSTRISSSNGRVNVGHSLSRRAQRLHGEKGLRFTTLRSGLDIVASSRGAVFGANTIARRNIRLNGRSIDVKALRGGPIVMLVSQSNVKSRLIKAKGLVAVVARRGRITSHRIDARRVVLHARHKPRIGVLRVRDPRFKLATPIEGLLGNR